MVNKKSVDEMTAQELYELAKAKEAEEQECQRETMRAELESAQAERKILLARHRKELAAIDTRIRELGGRIRSMGGKGGGRGRISSTVLDILSDKEAHSTTDIKAALANRGVVANNLNQTLVYLKRQGKVKSPKRSTYVIA